MTVELKIIPIDPTRCEIKIADHVLMTHAAWVDVLIALPALRSLMKSMNHIEVSDEKEPMGIRTIKFNKLENVT